MLSLAGRRDKEYVNVANEYVTREVVRRPSRKTRRLQGVKRTKKRKTTGFPRLAWTHCITMATWKEADASWTMVQHSQHVRHSFVQDHETHSWCDTLFRPAIGKTIKRYGETRPGFNVKGQASTSISRLQTNHCGQRLDGDEL